jgi:hypothetical protein
VPQLVGGRKNCATDNQEHGRQEWLASPTSQNGPLPAMRTQGRFESIASDVTVGFSAPRGEPWQLLDDLLRQSCPQPLGLDRRREGWLTATGRAPKQAILGSSTLGATDVRFAILDGHPGDANAWMRHHRDLEESNQPSGSALWFR